MKRKIIYIKNNPSHTLVKINPNDPITVKLSPYGLKHSQIPTKLLTRNQYRPRLKHFLFSFGPTLFAQQANSSSFPLANMDFQIGKATYSFDNNVFFTVNHKTMAYLKKGDIYSALGAQYSRLESTAHIMPLSTLLDILRLDFHYLIETLEMSIPGGNHNP